MRLLVGLATAAASLILAVLAVEGALRFTKPGQTVIYRVVPRVGLMRVPGQRGYQYGNEEVGQWVRLTVNAQGLRGGEIPAEKAPGEIRVLVLGDSFVFGGGLGDDDTLPAQAQRLCALPETSVRFMNAGGNGHNTRQSADYVERRSRPLAPDVFVMGWNWNDLIDINDEITGDLQLPSDWWRSFAIYKFWKHHQTPHWLGMKPKDVMAYRDRVVGAAVGPDSQMRLELAQRALNRIDAHAKKTGGRLFVLVMPELTWKESDTFPGMKRLAASLERAGIPWRDCQPNYYQAVVRGEHVTQNLDPVHPSAEGQELMAKVLLEGLWSLGWIPRKN
jgi:lysophospholipase L1-like esterase